MRCGAAYCRVSWYGKGAILVPCSVVWYGDAGHRLRQCIAAQCGAVRRSAALRVTSQRGAARRTAVPAGRCRIGGRGSAACARMATPPY